MPGGRPRQEPKRHRAMRLHSRESESPAYRGGTCDVRRSGDMRDLAKRDAWASWTTPATPVGASGLSHRLYLSRLSVRPASRRASHRPEWRAATEAELTL